MSHVLSVKDMSLLQDHTPSSLPACVQCCASKVYTCTSARPMPCTRDVCVHLRVLHLGIVCRRNLHIGGADALKICIGGGLGESCVVVLLLEAELMLRTFLCGEALSLHSRIPASARATLSNCLVSRQSRPVHRCALACGFSHIRIR